MVPTFKLASPAEKLERRDIVLADRTLALPSNANPLLMGEYVEYDAAYKAIRGTNAHLSFVVFGENGRLDIQGTGKVPTLYMGTYEADTLIFDDTGLALGDPLMVDTVTYDSLSRSGVKKWTTNLVLGYVTKLPAINGNKLRFIQTLV